MMTNGFAQPVEAELVERALAGEMDAHAELFRRFGPPVFTLARRLLQSRDAAEEVLQETFLDCMRRIDSFRGEAPFGFWLRRLAVNRCLMLLRSERQHQTDELLEEPVDHRDGFDAALRRADLEALLGKLSAESRAVLWLHEVEGYTHREIAALLNRTESYSKSQLARSHARLRALVLDGANEEVEQCTPKTAT